MSRPDKSKKLLIVGDSAFAEVACEYFDVMSAYAVAAFAVERQYIKRAALMGRPIVAWEDAEQSHPPSEYEVYVAVVYSQLNRLRTRLMNGAKTKGYRLASFVSPHAFLAPSATVGEHCFIFENNVVQSFVHIGDNVVLWSGNHIGHHSKIGDNVFVSSHVVVSGFCNVGENSFLGVNASLGNNVSIGKDCWLGAGVVVSKDVAPGSLLQAPAPEIAKVSAPRFFKVRE